MNPIEQLSNAIREAFPDACLDLDPAQKPNGTWFLDVRLTDYALSIEWQRHRGFGLTANSESGYGEGVDETYRDLGTALKRALALLDAKAFTKAPTAVTLDELRQSRRVTQEELAGRLDIRQASIAKLEKRSDIRLGTLRAFVEAMGGQVRIQAHFPDGTARTLRFPGLESDEPSRAR